MTDYTKLAKALRLCQFGECGCGKCYYKELKGDWCTEDNHPEFFDCDDKLKLDAAAAIEALQAEVDTLKRTDSKRCQECLYLGQPVGEQQLPKRGEWIWDDKRCIYVCSVCRSPKARENMDRQIIKEQAYCYSCGAKMEVQE